MSTQKITSGSVTYFVCECGNPPQYCKCSELARIAHLEQQAARLANLPGLPEGWVPPFTVYESSAFVDDASYVMDAKKRILNTGNSKFIASLLNACYPPAPGQQIT